MVTVLVRLTPAKPSAGEEVKIAVVARHPMEPGTRRNSDGDIIPADYLSKVTVSYDGQLVAEVEPQGGVSANPLLAFKMRPQSSGELVVDYQDLNGDSGQKTLQVEVA